MQRALPVAAAALLLLAPVGATAAAECGRGRSAADAAICANPELAAADAATAFAATALQRELPADRRAALEIDQQAWERARAASCGDTAGSGLVRCLLAETEARRRMLAGGGRNRDRGAPRVDPVFVHEARPGRYEIEIAYPQIVGDAAPAARAAFNQAAHDLILGDAGLMNQFRSADPATGGATGNTVFYDIHYLGPRLATIVFWLVSATGRGQHPFTARETLVFDLGRAKALGPEDVVAAPGQAVGPMSALCAKDLEAQAREQGWRPSAVGGIAAVIANFRNWAPGPFALDILFDAGSVAAVSAGPHACRLDYGALRPLLKRPGPLPPH